jgi:hypothetical protein
MVVLYRILYQNPTQRIKPKVRYPRVSHYITTQPSSLLSPTPLLIPYAPPVGRARMETRAASWKTSFTPRLCFAEHSAQVEKEISRGCRQGDATGEEGQKHVTESRFHRLKHQIRLEKGTPHHVHPMIYTHQDSG